MSSPRKAARSKAVRSKENLPALRNSSWPPLLLVFFVFLIYSSSLPGDFVFDDGLHVVENEAIHLAGLGLRGLGRAAFGGTAPTRPLAMATLALNYALGGLDPFGYRLFNVAVHAASSVVLYLLALLTLAESPGLGWEKRPARRFALLLAAFWAASPLQVQAVSYIVQRMTSLAGLFGLLYLYAHARSRFLMKGGFAWRAVGLVSLLAALGCKEIAAVFPLLAVIYDLAFVKLSWKKPRDLWPAHLAPFLVVAASALFFLSRDGGGMKIMGDLAAERPSAEELGGGERLLSQGRVILFYLSLLLFPHPGRLNLYHHFPASRALFDPPSTLPALIFLFLIAAYAVRFLHKRPAACASILWFLCALSLESGLLPLVLVNEHRLYVASAGFCLLSLLPLAGEKGRNLLGRKAGLLIAASVVLLLGAGTFLRNTVWADAADLYRDSIAKNPRDGRVYNNLAVLLEKRGELAEAYRCYEKALELSDLGTPALLKLALHHQRKGKRALAEKILRWGIERDPGNPAIYNSLALAVREAGRGGEEEAEGLLRRAVALDADYREANYNLGLLLLMKERPAEAIPYLERGGTKGAADPEELYNLAGAYYKAGRMAKAREILRRVADLAGRDPRGASILRKARKILGRGPEGSEPTEPTVSPNP